MDENIDAVLVQEHAQVDGNVGEPFVCKTKYPITILLRYERMILARLQQVCATVCYTKKAIPKK